MRVNLRVELPPPVEAVLAGLRNYETVLNHQENFTLEVQAWYGSMRRGAALVLRDTAGAGPVRVVLIYALQNSVVLGWHDRRTVEMPVGPDAHGLCNEQSVALGEWQIKEAVDTILGWLDAYRESLNGEVEPTPSCRIAAKPVNGSGNGKTEWRGKAKPTSYRLKPFPYEAGHVVASEADSPMDYTGKLIATLTRLDPQAFKDIPTELILAINEPLSTGCGRLNGHLWERIEERTPGHLAFEMRGGLLGFWRKA